MRRVQVYLDDWLDDELALHAHREGRSKASLIREASVRYLRDEDVAVPRGPAEDPMDAWIGGTLGAPGSVDDLLYGPLAEPGPMDEASGARGTAPRARRMTAGRRE